MVKLRLNADPYAGTKRFKAFVIYGRATGIIKSLQKFSDEKMIIPEGKPGEQRVVANRETENAMKYFIRFCSGTVQGCGSAPSEQHGDFVVRDGEMVVRPNAVQKHASSRKPGQDVMKKPRSIIK